MSDLKKPSTCKHLTFEDRIEIQDCLFHGVSFKGIAKRIGKDPTTVSKEIKKHIQVMAVLSPGSKRFVVISRLLCCGIGRFRTALATGR